jgi:hypothetical protein
MSLIRGMAEANAEIADWLYKNAKAGKITTQARGVHVHSPRQAA